MSQKNKLAKLEKLHAKLDKIGNKINNLENEQDEIMQINYVNDERSKKIDKKLDKLYRKENKLLAS